MASQDLPAAAPSEEQGHRLEEFIEEEKGHPNRYRRWLARFLTFAAVASSAFRAPAPA